MNEIFQDKKSLACMHIIRSEEQMVVIVKIFKPIRDDDSGKVYFCKKCWHEGPQELLEIFKTVCECCIKEKIKNYK